MILRSWFLHSFRRLIRIVLSQYLLKLTSWCRATTKETNKFGEEHNGYFKMSMYEISDTRDNAQGDFQGFDKFCSRCSAKHSRTRPAKRRRAESIRMMIEGNLPLVI